MSGVQSITSALSSQRRGTETISSNIAASGSDGEKGFAVRYKASVVPNGKGGYQFSGIKANVKQRVSEQGNIVGSAKSTHIAINGDGFMPVSIIGDKSKEILFTRLGTFDIDRQGNLVNENGYALRAWKLDDAGKLPGDRGNSDARASAEVASLDVVNVKSLTSKPNSTKVISLDARLNAGADTIKGAGQVYRFRTEDTFNNGIAEKDIIVPSHLGMSTGDSIKVKVSEVGTDAEYVYGGVTSSFNIKSRPIAGKTSISDTFRNGAVPAFDTFVAGHRIRVRVANNEAVDLKFVTNTPKAENREFSSLASLRDALNAIDGLTARIAGDTLYIAAKNGKDGVTFHNQDTSNFIAAIGLSDIAAATGGEKRYSTLATLKELMQENSDLKVVRSDSGGLDITAAKPTDSVTFTASSKRENAIKFISATQPGGAHNVRNNKNITIHAPHNGLKAGDFVELNGLVTDGFGLANVTTDGLYVVLAADDGSFTIAAERTIAVQAAVAAAPVAGTTYTISRNAGTWQKAAGTLGAEIAVAPGAGRTIESAAGTVTLDGAGAGPLPGGLAPNDVVWVSGIGTQNGITVPDGYYRVNANAGNTITIDVNGAVAAVAAAITSAYTVRKVGTLAAAGERIDTSVAFTNPGGGQRVRVAMPHSGFGVDDYVSFAGAAIDAAIDGKSFKITAVDTSAAGAWFEFELPAGDPVPAAFAAGAPMPAGAYVDFRGKLDQNIGFRQDKDGVSIDAVYDANGGEGRNLATAKFAGIWEQSVVVYDELGVPHNLRLAFAKIGKTEWAVQLYVPKDPLTGKYPIDGVQNGIIASGTINFNGNGAIQSMDGNIKGDIDIKWNNGSNDTKFMLNFGQTADDASTSVFTNGGVKHVNGENEVFSLTQDGYAPGKFIGLTVDAETGRLIASYDNGQTQAVYKIPVCFFAAPDELTAVGGASFRANFNSGNVVLKQSGDDGVGRYAGSAVEKSNIQATDEMGELVAGSQLIALNASAFATVNDSEKEFVRRT